MLKGQVFAGVLNTEYRPHVEYVDYFTPTECETLIAVGLRLPALPGLPVRSVGIDTLGLEWFWPRVGDLVTLANTRYFQYDLSRMAEDFQLVSYQESVDLPLSAWHSDFGAGRASLRKLSVFIDLSPRESYDGGAVEFHTGPRGATSTREQGSMLLFPSFVMHRVTPVTRGTKFALIGWAHGQTSFR